MPLIIGALLNNGDPHTLHSIDRCIATMQKATVKETQSIYYQLPIFIMAGKREGESVADTIIPLGDREGFCIGRLFDKKNGLLCKSLESTFASQVRKTEGTWLVESYWGRYITLLIDAQKESITIFRDPQGLATIFIADTHEGIFFSSELSLLYEALSDKLSFDWTYLTSFVANHHRITSHAPFKGVTELFPGYGITLSSQEKSAPFIVWDPTKLQVFDTNKPYEQVIAQTLSDCITAWTQENTTGIGVELSGGIDSSAVLTVLKERAPLDCKIVAFNFFHPTIASADEREHAKKVAKLCNVELECINVSEFLPLTVLPTSKTNKPSCLLLDHSINRETARRADIHGSLEFLGGQGGDHIFMASPALESLADHILTKGITGISTKAKEISAYYRMPLTQVFFQTCVSLLRYGVKTINHMPLIKIAPWMTPTFKEKIDKTIFKVPFWSKLRTCAPGKAQQIMYVYQAALYIDRGHRIESRSVVNPLLSQPLVELALSIPTYDLYGQGYDRIPFRLALEQFKKNDYMWRKSKGDTTGVLMLGLQTHFEKVCTIALEGAFAQENLIDKDLLYKHIKEMRHGKMRDLWPLINLLSAELWINTWKN